MDVPQDVLAQASRLSALAETGLLDALPQESLDRYTRIASMCIGAPVALVSLVDDHRQFFSSLVGLPHPWAAQRETPLSHSFCQLVVRTGQDLIVTDARSDERVRENLAIRDLGVQAYAGKPIRTSDDLVLGSFCVIDSKPRAWTDHELALLTELSEAVTAEVELRRQARRYEAAERSLASSNREIAQKVAASSLAKRQAVHDLRTPLGVVTLGVELLLQHDAVTSFPEMGRMLERIARNARHAGALVASMEGTRQRESLPPGALGCDLHAVATQTVHDLSNERLVFEESTGSGEALPIQLDETELRRCLENVIGNGLRFARERVLVTCRRVGDEALVWIDDDGPGLPNPEAYREVWERDVRLHVAQGLSGTGLGLSIVRELVLGAGGYVSAGRSPLGGARFLLAFPSQPPIPR